MTNSTYTPSVHLFVDMDGTLVTWKQAACFEELLQENYFRDLPPYKEVVDAINWLNSTYPEIDVHVLSAYMPENPYSVNEKNEWLDTYLPAISKENRIFVPCGISKAEAAAKAIGESTINSSCILLDDYSVNLHDWKENGGGCMRQLSKSTAKIQRSSMICSPEKIWTGMQMKLIPSISSSVTAQM